LWRNAILALVTSIDLVWLDLLEEVFAVERFRCRAVVYQKPGLPVVFLHGYMFTSDVWRDIGVLDALVSEGIPFLALDMPYGLRSGCSPRTRDPDLNVWVLNSAVKAYFGSAKPILVGASLGGYIALRYGVKHSAAGLLLIGPVKVMDEAIVKHYSSSRVPVKIIVGSRDTIADRRELERFAEMTGAELKVYEGAGHPAYLDNPSEFKADLLSFYKRVASSG